MHPIPWTGGGIAKPQCPIKLGEERSRSKSDVRAVDIGIESLSDILTHNREHKHKDVRGTSDELCK